MGLFDNAEEPENDFELVEEGEHVCRLDNMTLDLNGKFGVNFQLHFNIVQGEFVKRKLWQ